MGLLAPWFLVGALAVGVPLYLHLLRRDAMPPKPFPSLMFFEARQQSSVRHRRLHYLMLLALRLLLLLLLILAFADPYIMRPAAQAAADRLLVVVVDHSFSMRAGTRLEAAKSEAQRILAGRAANQKGQVMALGSRLEALTQATEDGGELRAAVQSIRPGDGRSSYAELARMVRAMAQTVPTPIDLHFISDLQKSSLPANFADLQMPANVTLTLHPIDAVPHANWAVESVQAPGQVWDPAQARVQATIVGFGTPARTFNASLTVNGKTVATRPVAVPANGRAQVQFDSLPVPYGFSRCAVHIDTGDILPADDSSVFAVERADPQHILFIHEAGDARSPLYFSAALQSAAQSAFTLDSVGVEQAENLDPSRYAFVVLSDVWSLPQDFETTLRRYVQHGGSVFIAAGTGTAHGTRIPVLEAPIITAEDYSRGTGFEYVGEADHAHPSIASADGWVGVKFFYALRVNPGTARVEARLADETPLLLDQTLGEGRILLFASGLDNLTNDFPLRPDFLPFVEQTSRYLAGTEQRGGARVVDSYLELRTPQEQAMPQAVGVDLIDPEGRRPLDLAQAAQANLFQLTEAGFYELRLATGRHDMVGVNADRRASNLAPMSDDTIALWQGGSGNRTGASSQADPTTQKLPYRLWWYVMLLVLVAALAESWLAGRYLAAQKERA